MTLYRLGHMLLQLAQIGSLSGQPAVAGRIIPMGDELAGVGTRFDCNDDLIHRHHSIIEVALVRKSVPIVRGRPCQAMATKRKRRPP